MKRFLATAITLSTLGGLPVQAGSVWLIMKEAVSLSGLRIAVDLEKLEMKDIDQCEEQGAIFMASERMGRKRDKYIGFECLEAK